MAKFLRLVGNSASGPGTSASSCLEETGVRRMVMLSVCCSSAADVTAKDTAAKERPKRAQGCLLRTRRGAVVVVDFPMVPSIMARLVATESKNGRGK